MAGKEPACLTSQTTSAENYFEANRKKRKSKYLLYTTQEFDPLMLLNLSWALREQSSQGDYSLRLKISINSPIWGPCH